MNIKVLSKRVTSFVLSLIMIVSFCGCFPIQMNVVASSNFTNNVIDRQKYYIKNVGSNKYLDISDISVNNGARLQLWDQYYDHQNQIFAFVSYGKYWRIMPTHTTKKVLEVRDSKMDEGAPVAQWDGSNDSNYACQLWEIVDNQDKEGSVSFRNVNSSLYMDVEGGKKGNGTKIIQAKRNTSSQTQKFLLSPVLAEQIQATTWYRKLNYDTDIQYRSIRDNLVNGIEEYNSTGFEKAGMLPVLGQKIVVDVNYYSGYVISEMTKAKSIQDSESDQINKKLLETCLPEVANALIDLFKKRGAIFQFFPKYLLF